MGRSQWRARVTVWMGVPEALTIVSDRESGDALITENPGSPLTNTVPGAALTFGRESEPDELTI